MKLIIPCCLIAITLLLHTPSSDAVIPVLAGLLQGYDIFNKAYSSFKTFKEITKLFDKDNTLQQTATAFKDIHDISLKLDGTTSAIVDLHSTIKKLDEERKIEKIADRDRAMLEFFGKQVGEINNEFHYNFVRFVATPNIIRDPKIPTFIDNVRSNNLYFKIMTTIRDLAANKESSSSIFGIASRYYKSQPEGLRCGGPSIYLSIYNLYEDIVRSVTKGYMMMFMGYQFLLMENKTEALLYADDYRSKQKFILGDCEKDIRAITTAVRLELEELNLPEYKKTRACNPKKWIETENYIRIKNRVSYYAPTTKYLSEWAIDEPPSDPEYECNKMQIYHNPTNPSEGVVYSLPCPFAFDPSWDIDPSCKNLGDTFTEKSIKNLTDVCLAEGDNGQLDKLCACDKQMNPELSVRTISLRHYTTNSSDSRVITGIRFVVRDNVIGIEIQEGKLENGVVSNDTVKWVKDNGQPPEDGPDSIRLSTSMRSFDLDDIELPEFHLVTGVKFVVTKGRHIALSVRGSIMYDKDHKTFPSKVGEWFIQDTPYRFEKSMIPLQSESKNSGDAKTESVELSKPGISYVNLTVASYAENRTNIGVVPFFDSRGVVSNPPMALGGLGLLYKGNSGYGGFLALKYIISKYNIFFY